jgi:hypothetical protein
MYMYMYILKCNLQFELGGKVGGAQTVAAFAEGRCRFSKASTMQSTKKVEFSSFAIFVCGMQYAGAL